MIASLSNIRRIAVYLNVRGEPDRRYLLSFLCTRWREAGIAVLFLDDPRRKIDAEVAFLHVDATRRPQPTT